MKEITLKRLQHFETKFEQKPVQKALSRVLMKNELQNLFDKQEQKPKNQFRFSHEIKTLPVTAQKQSGRCWIFAGLNVLREVIAKKYNLKDFEFSQNYTAFYDKLEKINYFIESIDDFLEVDQDDRTLQHILKTGIQDGGQWDMFVSLIEKYGVVPKEYMVETSSSSQTAFMNRLINIKLRQYAANARRLKAENKASEIADLKEKTLDELYTFLSTNFGVPPKTFDFEYVSNDEYHIEKDLNPVDFYHKYLDNTLKDYVSIIHAPTKDKPYMKTYTVQYLGNVVGGREIKYLNVEMKDLKALVIKQLTNNELVWFGSDVGRYGDRVTGVWDDHQLDDEQMLGMSLYMSKEDQLDYSQGAMNHAMVITAVNLDEGIPNRWKIENSWGDQVGQKGYFMCSDTWFDQYVYQAVIHVKYLSDEQKNAWKQKPIELKPWDPMGSLAK
ncbi:MAG: C1 family peptidase [Acholeplasmataceae bacterium]|jgi:bleomycin hydrolase|nr:C1 family peptidase [Acholeplasmataceae bacterium]